MSFGAEWKQPSHARRWAARRARLPHRDEAESILIEHLLPDRVERVLDLGTGDGHLLALIREARPGVEAVGLDLSAPMLEAARERFSAEDRVELLDHDLMQRLPADLGTFDLAVSALAIHHLPDERKRKLYSELLGVLRPGGAFCNFDVTAAPTPSLHLRAQAAFGWGPEGQDPSDQLCPLDTQLAWLRDIGFRDVDCHWKWLELALLAGVKP